LSHNPLTGALALLKQVNPGAYLNAFLAYASGRLRVTKPRSLPLKLDIILTKACNLRCTFCISYGSLTGERWMDFGLYERIARRLFPTAFSVLFCSGGEPLLYPRLREALKLAQTQRTATIMVSNGMLLDRETARWLVADQSLHDLRISFDGASKETLERIRRGARYETILENLAYLTHLKRRQGRVFPRLSLRYVVMKSNAPELPEIFRVVAPQGVERVEAVSLIVANDLDFQESLFNHRQLAAEVFAQARCQARQYGIALKLPPLPGSDAGRRRCRQLWEFCQIDTDGSIRICYPSWRQRLGFFDDGFERVWRGLHYQRLRQTVDSSIPYFPYCRHCYVHQGFNQKSSHHQELQPEAYTIPGLEDLQVPFNERRQENLDAWRSRERLH